MAIKALLFIHTYVTKQPERLITLLVLIKNFIELEVKLFG